MSNVYVHVTPKSSASAVCGLNKTADGLMEVKVKVTAPPEDGKANKAVCKVVADALGVAKSKVSVAAGDTSRHKRLEVDIDQASIDEWLSGL